MFFLRKSSKLGIVLLNINQIYTNHLIFIVFYVKMVKISFEDMQMAKFIPYTFTKKDVIGNFINDKQYENWIAGQVRSKKIVKVRNGLYVHVDVSGYPLTTKFELATKIAEDAFVCYHSAFEYFGVANQVFNTVTVGSKKRFNDFTFDDIDYVRKPLKHDVQIMNIVTAAVRVTSLERTVIDCLDDIDAGGGIDEILNALDQIRVLDETKLLETLKAYDSVFLYQKAGYVLEHFQDKFMLTDSFFKECKSKLTNQIKYFLQDEYKEIEFNSKWKLMAPKNLKSRLNGGY